MKKEFKVNGKVTYPQGTTSRTTYTLINNTGNMITLAATTDTDFDYGDDVVMDLEKKDVVVTTADNVSGSVTTSTATASTTEDSGKTSDTTENTVSNEADSTAAKTTATADNATDETSTDTTKEAD